MAGFEVTLHGRIWVTAEANRVCKAAKGQGAEIDTSVGYTKPNPNSQ
jgi:hypothetical protein